MKASWFLLCWDIFTDDSASVKFCVLSEKLKNFPLLKLTLYCCKQFLLVADDAAKTAYVPIWHVKTSWKSVLVDQDAKVRERQSSSPQKL